MFGARFSGFVFPKAESRKPKTCNALEEYSSKNSVRKIERLTLSSPHSLARKKLSLIQITIVAREIEDANFSCAKFSVC